ncbi:MAG: gamma-glutamyltranspeptidase/glutathione hydrolase [Halieaceae bacterium]|jgi:gamma-glutamyltranspeptidase/glutathione hydrolase
MSACKRALPVQKISALVVFSCLLVVAHPLAAASKNSAAIATPEPHATRAAVSVLNNGGNAVDAATAVAFVLAVTLPDAGNIGGGGFMTLYVDGKPSFLDYRETAPAAAHRDMYLDERGEVLAGASLTGHRAVGTPGTVAGLWAAHERYGTLPWAALLQPAIDLAELGFSPEPWFIQAIDDARPRLAEHTNFLDYFGAAQADQIFRQPELAATLTRIAKQGRRGFYRGATAKLLVAEMRRGNGLLTAKDIASYEPRWRQPLLTKWRQFELLTAPPPSSGGFAIIQYLKMKDMLSADFAGLAHNSPQFIHLKAEIEKRIFADRARYLGDPDFVDLPLGELLEESYIQRRADEVNPLVPSTMNSVSGGLEPTHTTHFSILDSDGNAVSNTYTLNTDFGSGVVVKGAGFLLNNEMDDFSAAPGKPNYYGVVGDESNAIAAGKRMLSSMAPTILLRDGHVAMVLGAMGGSTIFTTVYQTITNIIEFGMRADTAQAVPRVHHQLVPDKVISYSPSTPLPPETITALERRGYLVKPHYFAFGNVQLIWVQPNGQVSAASDPRFAGCSVVLAPARRLKNELICADPRIRMAVVQADAPIPSDNAVGVDAAPLSLLDAESVNTLRREQ